MSGRVAIYALPGAGGTDEAGAELRRTAESWLGRGADGTVIRSALPDGWTRDAVDEITVDARRYGFHGTLKSPFRLAEGRTLAQLTQDVDRFAAAHAPVTIPRLELARIGQFFALTPDSPVPELGDLADAVVTDFDEYRAPLTAAELARRNPDSLTPRGRELLAAWGYPYVLDEFVFHLTLTDRIPTERQAQVNAALTDWFARSLGLAVSLDALALFTESEPGAPFRLLSVHPLTSTTDHDGDAPETGAPESRGAR